MAILSNFSPQNPKDFFWWRYWNILEGSFNWKKETLIVYLRESNEGEYSHSGKHDGWYQHDHSWANVGAEEGDGSQPATDGHNRKV